MFGQEEKKEVFGAETLYRELGNFQKGRTQYYRSFPAFDKAVELTPDDLRALIGRSWARAKTAYYKCALKDINTAVDKYPEDLCAMQLKALYTFLYTDFEDAMVQNYRGIPKRKKPDLFIIGAMQCAEEIERCIGKRGGHALRDHYDIIRTIAWKKAIDLRNGYQWKPRFKKRKRKPKKTDNTPALYTKYLKKAKHQDNIKTEENSALSILESLTDAKTNEYHITPKPKSRHQPPQARTTNIDNMMAEKYLEKMCYDKTCLRKLKSDPRLQCPNYSGMVKINQLARKGYKNVAFRQEVLRIRQPFYSIKYGEVQPKGTLLRRQQAELKKIQDVAKKDAETLIKLLRAARESYLTNTCIQLANKTKTYIDKKSLKILPNKESYLRQLYELIGLAHLDAYRLKENMSEWDTIKRINFLFGLPISREPSKDSVIRENKREFMDAKKPIVQAEERMNKATTPLETVWLFYDLARFSLDVNKWDLSRFYARKSLNMARILENYVWATNASMLITRTHVLQRNRNEAKNELMKTKEFAKNLGYIEILQYIDKCIEVVETIDFDEICAAKVIAEREKQIVGAIVGTSQQKELALLFMKMDAIPASRRMSIMPGVRMEDAGKSVSRKSSGKPSIKPKSKVDLEFLSHFGSKKGLDILDVD